MIGIDDAVSKLPDTYLVQVGAFENEVKEVLFHLRKNSGQPHCFETVNLKGSVMEKLFLFKPEEEKNSEQRISPVKRYLLEPNNAVRKTGAFKLTSVKFGIEKSGFHTHLYTSDHLPKDFPGRIFEVLELLLPSKKVTRKGFADGKVNVIARNYPQNPVDLKKKFSLKDGGEEFLIFCNTHYAGHVVYRCARRDLDLWKGF